MDDFHEYTVIWDRRIAHTEKLIQGKWILVEDPEQTKILMQLNYGDNSHV